MKSGSKPAKRIRLGFYAYCVGEEKELAPLLEDNLPPAIEGKGRLSLVAAKGLAAVVSPVPLSDYGENVLSQRLADPAWTTLRALRHEEVVKFFALRASVIPLRFGTIYLQRRRLEEMLWKKKPQLFPLIKRLRGREEWGINVYGHPEQLLKNVASSSPRLRKLDRRASLAPPGRSYLLRKQIDALRTDEAKTEIKRVVNEIERVLRPLSEDFRRLRVLRHEATELGSLAAKIAFLVPRPRFREFRLAAERLARKHSRAGFQLELTGPWPAYNFVDDGER